jgi:hypothetical protein
MFLKPSPPAVDTPRPARVPFAETQFVHDEADDDYAGFAPTELADDEPAAPRRPGPGDEAWLPPTWGTSHWAELDEPPARAAETRVQAAARQAREVISAQRWPDAVRSAAFSPAQPPAEAAAPAPRPLPTGLRGRLGRLLHRVLPGELASLLPLFLCVSAALALIAAVLPMLDKT